MSSRRRKHARRQIPIVNAFPPIPPVPGVVAPGVITGGTVVVPQSVLVPHPPVFFHPPVPPPLFYLPGPFY